MRRLGLVYVLVLGVAPATAQPVVVDTIRAVQPWPPHGQYMFPHLNIPGKPQLAARIHRDLCMDFLGVDPDTARGSIFQKAWGGPGDDAPPPRLSSLSWTFTHPLPEVISIMLAGEECGANCGGFTVHYTYDLREGQRLRYGSLFTAEALAAVDDTLRKHWQAAVGAQLRLIQDSLTASGPSGGDWERWQEEAALYRQCLGERAGLRPYVADMEPLKGALRVWIAGCGATVNKELDVLGSVSVTLPFAWLVSRMKPGMAVLFRE